MEKRPKGAILDIARSFLKKKELPRQKVISEIFLVRSDCVGEDDETISQSELTGQSGEKYYLCVKKI